MLRELNFTIAYLYKILIKSENQEQHIQHVNEVFRKINKYKFKLSDEKCEFFMTEMKYLVQISNKTGPNQSKCD